MKKTNIIQSLTRIAAITIILSIALPLHPSYAHENHENHENKSITVSVWDKITVNYKGSKKITVYRSPSCGCCGQWITHMKKHGFEVTDIKTNDIETIKAKNNIPPSLASCHTAIINGYAIEGHIPADDIKRFLTQKPNMKGLAVGGMPIGSPGMESEKMIKQPFDVMAFNENEIKLFRRHTKY